MSNIDSSGGLCYLSPGSVVLDRFDPAGSIAMCLQSAEELLNSFIDDPAHNKRAVQDEFLAYWSGGGKHVWAVIGDVPAEALNAGVSFIDMDEQRASLSLPMISSSSQEVEQVAQALGGKVQGEQDGRCWLLRTGVYPIAPVDGLPTTLRELFGYLKSWDQSLSRRVQRILSSDKAYLKYRLVTFAVLSPAGWVGFSFSIESFLRLTGHRRLPSVCLQYLHRRGESIEITRLVLTEIGARFIHSRNLAHASLIDKRVTIIGCGAVGGYIAQAVARLGAGAGGGKFRLIDPGILEPGNIGRHWLGMDSLFAPKVTSAARVLRQQFPYSTFIDCVQDVRDVTDLFDADLVIDATGVESVSEMINAHHVQRDRNRPPVLYAWILGNGDCVQGLWVDSKRYGCYRCLRQPKGANYRDERFPVLKEAPTTLMIGCQAVTPYSVATPIEAAALCTEFVIDWLKGAVTPRLRHRFRQNADVRHQKCRDMSKIAGCPACSVT
jgi:molybdopterin/thiamine biosynthesis adenylyltransferase